MRWQLALALAAGCTRVICIANGIAPELIALQHDAERGGASFHVIAGPRGLSPLVTAADEVLVIAEGLLVTTSEALGLLGSGPVVLVQPAESGIPAGFERVDINHAAAGLMMVPGRLVERLMDLEPDVDAASALLRIALHSGAAQREVPVRLRDGGHWLLIRSEAEAQDAEDNWMARHTAVIALTPGPLAARYLVRRFGSALLHEQRSNFVIAVTAAFLAILGLALSWFGHGGSGLLLAGLGWVLRQAASMLERLREQSRPRGWLHDWREVVFSVFFDLTIVAILVCAIPAQSGQPLYERLFAPAMLVGLSRLLPRGFRSALTVWAEDRFALALLLAALAVGGVLELGVPALSALFVFTGLLLPPAGDSGEDQSSRITRA